ncbi:hypothetical protein N7517_000437 [Penicillium concentricum]|uniref:Uncharacterized protein n=1 Tax=Penicillium concentricum TaxID=293559 RepID=A0A9W9VKB8_9EURO|nr:uncharacterized protein N7517_000437 [Penicillium concentricum]KAJ5382526.1 hypothetical protein N7517_000437 [Penicillium concentricum]
MAQTEDQENGWTSEAQMVLVLLIEAESKANGEKFRSLLAQLPRHNSETRRLRREFKERQAKKNRYLERCRAAIRAGGRIEDVQPEE